MDRRKFLQNVAWLTGGLLLIRSKTAKALAMDGRLLTGLVRSRGKGLKDAVVSDGYSVVLTDKRGRYSITAHPDALALFVSTPSGYEFTNENGISRHYHQLQNVRPGQDANFDLVALGKNDNEHEFIIWADPQIKNKKDVEKMMEESVPCVKKYVAAAGAGTLIHGITVGDIVWDELQLFEDYNKAVAQMGVPFFQCLGNHDMDYRKG